MVALGEAADSGPGSEASGILTGASIAVFASNLDWDTPSLFIL